jgi:hypothetical protein
MKKLLLICLILSFGLFAYSQKTYKLRPGVKVMKVEDVQPQKTGLDLEKRTYIGNPVPAPRQVSNSSGRDIVTVINIGSAANIYTYGYANGTATYVWYNKDLNAVTNLHRMGGPVGPAGQYSGDLCYDISLDGGQTWTNQVKIYTSNIPGSQYNLDAARYPQGALYNPAGNTDPANAYMTFFAATMDGSNGGQWGSYGYGVGNLVNLDDTTKHLLTSDLENGYYQGIPTAYLTTRNGNAVMADAALLDSYTEYMGNIIFMRGVFNEDLGDFEWEQFLHEAPAGYARYLKIAFDPTGQTGYVLWCDGNGSIPMMEGWSYPLLLKTEDGGETWSDVISVNTSGPDGIDAIKNWLTDEMIQTLWEPPYPTRDEILFTTPWFNTDIGCDAWGNPHIGVTVFIGGPGLDPGYILVEPESFGVFDIYSIDDNNEEWYAVNLGTLSTYSGEFVYPGSDPLTEYNRIDVTSSWDGTKMFFTWLETRLPGVETNTSPDIYARGFDLFNNKITKDTLDADVGGACNVTNFSEAMWQSYFKAGSYYSIDEGDPGEATYTIPLVYADMDPQDVTQPVQFKYIQDFSFTDADFIMATGNPPISPVGIKEPVNENIALVSQNYPNPFGENSNIHVKLIKSSTLSLEIHNITGQKVMEINKGNVAAGSYTFTIDGSALTDGVYFYTVTAGTQKVTRKMLIN